MRLHEKFGYEYSGANNVAMRTNNALVQTFTSDGANQLTNLSRAGTLTVAGLLTRPASTLSVNSVTNGSLYADRTWASPGHTLLNNVSNAFAVTALDATGTPAQGTTTIYGAPAVTLSYDANGNLTSDQRRVFEYDADNQLTNVYEPGAWRSQFLYDGLNRRRVRREFTWSGGAWSLTNETRYLYDGMLVLQERDSNNIPLVTYTRGLDLSGSLQGAGGIGGLLALSDQRADASNPTNYFYHADGNGNIVALLNKKSEVVARYLYDPFGNLLARSGPMAEFNRYRFSSKEAHQNSGLYYYGYRYYEPYLQRWLTKDPIGERGGMNLYRFVRNSPFDDEDPFGLTNQPGDFGWDWYSVPRDSVNWINWPEVTLPLQPFSPIVPPLPNLSPLSISDSSTALSTPEANVFTYDALLPGAPHLLGTPIGEELARQNATEYMTAPGLAKIPCLKFGSAKNVKDRLSKACPKGRDSEF